MNWVVSIDSTIARVHQHGATLARDTGGWTESQESGAVGVAARTDGSSHLARFIVPFPRSSLATESGLAT